MAFTDTNITQRSDQIVPEVMAAMIQAQLPKAIKFSSLATVDDTLQGVPGDTITVPRWKYIGDAVDFAEGESIDYSKLTNDKTTTTIKRAGKGVEITDFSRQVGYGDPLTEGTRQLGMSIASKVDNDCLDALLKARLAITHPTMDLELIDAIEAAFEDDTSELNIEDANPVSGLLIINKKDFAALRKAAANNWERASELGDTILTTGVLGQIFGWQIMQSRKVPVGTYLAVKQGALSITMKRGIQVETERNIDEKYTKVNCDEYYGVWLQNDSRALVVNRPVHNPVTGLTMSQKTASMKVGDTKDVIATALPADADDAATVEGAITYASDTPAVATVDADGKITAVAEGSATITATSGSFTATVAVTVAAAA